MKLIIARPSPYARKARIALLEKGIDHEVTVDIPWNPETAAPAHNPLGKIPILILDDGSAVYDSRVIVEYLDTLGRPPRLIPDEPGPRIAHKQVEALSDGICDAVVLIAIEGRRSPALRSSEWVARQQAKVEAGTADLARRLGSRRWFVGDAYGLADVAAGCALGYLDLRLPEFPWRSRYADLVGLMDRLSARPSFAATLPEPQMIAEIR